MRQGLTDAVDLVIVSAIRQGLTQVSLDEYRHYDADLPMR
jgi:hypothetical protein